MSVPTPRSRLEGQGGYTLIELLLAIAIMGVIYAGVATIMIRMQMSYETTAATMDLRQQARIATNKLTFEMRQAGSGLKNVGEIFLVADADEVAFAGDVDHGDTRPPCADETGNAGVERISYRFAADSIERKVECWDGATWLPEIGYTAVASNVDMTASGYRFFQLDSTEIVPGAGGLTQSERVQIDYVQLTVRMAEDEPTAFDDVPAKFEYSTYVLIRNSGEVLTHLGIYDD